MADNQTHGDARVLGLIPARGGSKGLPGKNLLDACGRPLIGWSVKSALDSRTITRTVTTTDSPEIAAVAAQQGSDVPFMRPAELATDEAGMMETVFHALDQLPNFDYVMLLQPTSPLRTAEDIDTAFQLLRDSGANSCVSVTRTTENPFLTFTVEGAARHMRQVVQPVRPSSGGRIFRRPISSTALSMSPRWRGCVNRARSWPTTPWPMSCPSTGRSMLTQRGIFVSVAAVFCNMFSHSQSLVPSSYDATK